MCYSIESSLRTSGFSLIAIIYLLTSGIPKFQYLGVVLIGWCIMQFAEALLWMTYPKKCTLTNKLITLILIPIVLALQPLGPVWGSLFLEPWEKNKKFIILYTIFIISILFIQRHIINKYFFKYKDCTIITPDGHLDWSTSVPSVSSNKFNIFTIFLMIIWCGIIAYPLFKFWNGKRLWPFYIIPLCGLFIGFFTDSPASIWCHITSYGSLSAIVLLFLHKRGIKILD
jgi:hypothetical protein